MVIWGGTFAAGKTASEGAGPLSCALWRFVMASLILIPQLRLSEKRFFPEAGVKVWIGVFLSGVSGLVLYNYFFIRGLHLTGAGKGSVIVTISPVFVYLGAVLFFGEKLTLPRVFGMLVAVSGTALVVANGNPLGLLAGEHNLGDLLMLGCVLSWSVFSLLGKFVVGKISPLAANAWSAVFAAILLVPLCVLSGEPLAGFLDFDPATWGAIAFLGVFGTCLGFTFFYNGIMVLGPHKASVYITLVPFFGLLSGAVFHGETITFWTLAGLFASLFGLALIQKY
jgi:drug/metabolite transporter (DMT)-like permease